MLLGILRIFVIGSFAAASAMIPPLSAGADIDPPDEARDRLTFDELLAEKPNLDGPIHNDYFMPIGAAEPAHHQLSGVLKVASADLYAGSGLFPSFASTFITFDGYLLPAERGILRSSSSEWDIVLSPGRVWTEPGDNGWSRASFPFVLVGKRWDDAHNGIATFLYNETEVSDLQMQIVQEASSWDRFDTWARLPMTYIAGPIPDRSELETAFSDELARRLPEVPLASLDADADLVAGMEHGLNDVTVTALLSDGVLYRGPCHTRFGDYPYCEEMRHAVYSVTKTAGAALSLLWLAQTYGPQVLDLKIVDYVDVTANHDGWNDVTFRDAIDMATGVGEMAPERVSHSFDFTADEFPATWRFGDMATARGKLDVAFSTGNYAWGPGEVARYKSMHTFVLAAAMDAYLKRTEGPEANLWESVSDEVLKPIGIHFAPLNHTRELGGGHGLPIMASGFFPTLDDLAKIAQLYQNRGAFEGRQLLYADEIDKLLQGNPDRGLPIYLFNNFGQYSYDFSLWYMPYDSADGCLVRIPEMMGYGGNLVAMMPNGMVGIRLADANEGSPAEYDGENMAALADSLRSFCP